MKIVLKDLTKVFQSYEKKAYPVTAVDHFSFEIPDGKLVALLGPSGCGKSTTLNMICGLEEPTEGQIYFGDQDITNVPVEKRDVGMVFQSYALYPHLTVKKNILFPLENRKGKDRLSKEEMEAKAMHVAKLVQIENLMDRKPSELSGGQQQRVAIARAIANRPKVLIADEPTGNLDPAMSDEIMSLLEKVNSAYGTTIVMVTHDTNMVNKHRKRTIVLEHGHIMADLAEGGYVQHDQQNI